MASLSVPFGGVKDGSERRRELAAFLVSRRQRVAPEDVGLPGGGRRRTPGLRREEIAALAGVSVTWYTWLEQAREITVSEQVLESLARHLLLSPDERRHLMDLGRPAVGCREPSERTVTPILQRLVERLEPSPAYALGPRWDILAWNRGFAALIGDPAALPVAERNMLWLVFTAPSIRALLPNWEQDARRVLSQYRAASGRYAGDPGFAALTGSLLEVSQEFRAWWDNHDVAGFRPASKCFRHPTVGELQVEYVKLAPVDDPEIQVIVHLPLDEPTNRRMARLAQRRTW